MFDRVGEVVALVGDLLDAGVDFDAAVESVHASGYLDPKLLRAAFDRTSQFGGTVEADQLGSLLAALYVRSRSLHET